MFTLAVDTPQAAFDELLVIAQRWIYLAAVDGLGNLESNEKSIKVKREGGSMGERIRAFLLDYQEQKGFSEFALSSFIEARHQISEIWREYQTTRENNEEHQALSGFSKLAIQPKVARPMEASSTRTILAHETRDQRQEIFLQKLQYWEIARDAVGEARRNCDSTFDQIYQIIGKWRNDPDSEAPTAIICPEDIFALEESSGFFLEARDKVLKTKDREENARKEYEEAKRKYLR